MNHPFHENALHRHRHRAPTVANSKESPLTAGSDGFTSVGFLKDARPTRPRADALSLLNASAYEQVLCLLETFSMDDLHAAVKKALQLGAVGVDAVKHLVLCHVEKRPPKLDLDVYPYLPRANVETTRAASHMP